MKQVTFKVAKVLKEAGYPQPQTDVSGYVNCPNNCYFTGNHSYWDENRERRLDWDETNEFHKADDWVDEIEPSFYGSAIAAPTYLEAWLWLWREKRFPIDAECMEKLQKPVAHNMWENGILSERYNDPEEVIIAAIDYLVDNNLIK